jgi:RNA polymerase sigma factor (sigma-70 family)
VNVQYTHSDKNVSYDEILASRRAMLTHVYGSLPLYGSLAFWRIIEEDDAQTALPFEVLVKCARLAIAHQDNGGRNRIIAIIFQRTAEMNTCWADNVLKSLSLPVDEKTALRSDLYADLCECVIRAILDGQRTFWEENFLHCLLFERKHVFASFMKREGRWQNLDAKKTLRIPRVLVQSLDQRIQRCDGNFYETQIEDELAQKALLSLEYADVFQLILHLPDKFKSVLLLIFWEDKTEKDTARILGITERTVRNRLRTALKILQEQLIHEREYANG